MAVQKGVKIIEIYRTASTFKFQGRYKNSYEEDNCNRQMAF